MTIKINLLREDVTPPLKGSKEAAGIDIYANKVELIGENIIKISTGLALNIPEGTVSLLVPRSSIYKKGLILANSVGIIDSDYSGEIFIMFRILDTKSYQMPEINERIAQLLFLNLSSDNIEVTSELDLKSTERGSGGFGSTGKN